MQVERLLLRNRNPKNTRNNNQTKFKPQYPIIKKLEFDYKILFVSLYLVAWLLLQRSSSLGKRESNTLVIYPEVENNPEKFGIILDSSGGT